MLDFSPVKSVVGEGVGGADSGVEARRGPSAGYDAFAKGCALAEAPASSWLELRGDDRLRFLNGQTTCDLKELEPGQGAYGFLLNAKGRVLADVVVTAASDLVLVELPAGAAEPIADHLRRYIVADRVEIAVLEPGSGLWVAGPGAAAVLRVVFAGCEPPREWDREAVEAGDGPVTLRGEKRLGVRAWRLDAAQPGAGLTGPAAELERAGAVRASAGDLDVIRIERGVPRAGVDFGEEHFPQETGLEEWAVSYTKGCYIGQEVVARIHYRGKVNHTLRGLRASVGAAPVSPGALTDRDGEPAGSLTSAAWSPVHGRAVGLAILHRKWAAPGTRLRTGSGAELEVVELPFVDGMAMEPGEGR